MKYAVARDTVNGFHCMFILPTEVGVWDHIEALVEAQDRTVGFTSDDEGGYWHEIRIFDDVRLAFNWFVGEG